MLVRDRLPTMIGSEAPLRSNPLQSLAVQFSVAPQWVAHRYFVAKVSLGND